MLVALGVALSLHGALALILSRVRVTRRASRVVEVQLKKNPPPVALAPQPPSPPPPPSPTSPPPPEPPKPRPKVKRPEPAKAPIPNETPKEPPKEPSKEPPKPVFGVTMSSTTEGDSSFTVPVGNTTIADPTALRPKGPVQPLPPAPPAAPPAPVFKPATEAEIDKYPEFEEGSCDAKYPDGEAKEQGVEGDTVLRVEIDENGKVRGVRVLKGVGHGLDELAVKLLKTKCRYSPARSKAGKNVPFVITHYVTWTLD